MKKLIFLLLLLPTLVSAQLSNDKRGAGSAPVPKSALSSGGSGSYSDVAARFYDVRDYGIVANNPSAEAANTTAMNSLLATVLASHGGTIYFPEKGIYYVSCIIPQRVMPPTGFTPCPIQFLGSTPPYLAIGTLTAGYTRLNDEWTIIRTTTSTPAITTNSAVLSNSWIVYIDNIECQSTGPAQYCVDLQGAAECSINRVLVSNGTWGTGSFPYSNTGLNLPPTNNGGHNYIGECAIVGFETGLVPGEHFVADHIICMFNINGIRHQTNYHPNIIKRYQCAHNRYDLLTQVAGAPTCEIRIDQFDVESDQSGENRANIYDPQALLRGEIQYSSIKAGFGVWPNFVIISEPYNVRSAQLGRTFQEFTTRGTLLSGGKRYIPVTNNDRWGQTYGYDIWYAYTTTADLGTTYPTPSALEAGVSGWIAQKYDARSRGSFVGLRTGAGSTIGFTVDNNGVIIVYDGSGATVNSSVAAKDQAFYRLNRTSGAYTIDVTTNTGTNWTTVYTIKSPFAGTNPSGAYTAIMNEGLVTTGGPGKVAGVYYPQGSF